MGDTSERKGGQSNSALKPDRRDGGGWRKNAATGRGRKASEVGLQAFLRLIKDIRGRLARYFSSPSVNRGAQPPPSIIPQKVDEGILRPLTLPRLPARAIIRNGPHCKLQRIPTGLFAHCVIVLQFSCASQPN